MTRRVLGLAAVLGLVAALAAPPAAPAQSRPVAAPERSPFLEGTHAFRRILYDATGQKLVPLRAGEPLPDPAHALIVVLGDPRPLDAPGPAPGAIVLRSWIAAAPAGRHRSADAALLERGFGVRVTGDLLTLPGADGDTAYRGMRECPYLQPESGKQPNLFEPARPVVRGEPAAEDRQQPAELPPAVPFTAHAVDPGACRGVRPRRRQPRPAGISPPEARAARAAC